MRSRRDPIVEVSGATRDLIERAQTAGLSPLEMRVVLAIIHRLSTWSWLAQSVSSRDLAKIVYDTDEPSGYQRERVAKALHEVKRKIPALDVQMGAGRYAAALVHLPSTWRDGTTISRSIVARADHDGTGERGSDESSTWCAETSNVARRVGHIENFSENSPEQTMTDNIINYVRDRINKTAIANANGRIRDQNAYLAAVWTAERADRLARLPNVIATHRPDTPRSLFTEWVDTGTAENLRYYPRESA
jgi:hypothetical protein